MAAGFTLFRKIRCGSVHQSGIDLGRNKLSSAFPPMAFELEKTEAALAPKFGWLEFRLDSKYN